MSELTPRERRQERTRQAILDTALELIIKKGLNKLSLREIARKIDYSPAGLYEYFGSKDEIIDAVVCHANERFYAHLSRVPTGLPVEDYLVELGMAYMEFARLYPDHFMLMFTQYQALPDMSLDEYEPEPEGDSFGLLFRAVERAIDKGIFKLRQGHTMMDIAYNFWALVHGMAMLQATYLRHYEWDFEKADHHGIRAFIEGMKQG